MIIKETKLLFHIQQLKDNLSIPINSKQNLLKFFTTITNIIHAPGLFLFLQKVIVKAMHRVSQFVNKMGGQYAKTFQEIIHNLVEKSSNYLFGSILYESIKKMNVHIQKLDKKQKEQQNMEILKNILEDKQQVRKIFCQQASEKKKLTSQDFFFKKTIHIQGGKLKKFEQIYTIINTKINDKTIEKKFGKVLEKNQLKRKMIEDQLKRKMIEDQLKRKMVALLNEGGGYILLGQYNADLVIGAKSEDFFQYKKKIYKYKSESIFPNDFDLQFEFVDLEKQNGKKQIHEKLLKIILFPKNQWLYFVLQKNDTKANPTSKFLNQKDCNEKNTYILTQNQQNCQLMVKLYDAYKKLKKKKSKIESKSISEKIIQNNKLRKQIIYGQKKSKKFLMVYDAYEPLKLIYKHTSIFMIKESDRKLYENFTKNLDERKILYVADCPFGQDRGPSSRLIAVINHQDKFEVVYQIAKDTAGKKLNALITVYPFVVIKEVTKKQYDEYQKVFTQKYGVALKPHRQQQQKGDDLQNVYLQFKGKQESIFTFIFMEAKGVRTQFLKKAKYLDKINS